MSRILLFTAMMCFLRTGVLAQWSSEIELNSGINEGYNWPRLQMSNEDAFVIWGNSATGVIYANKVASNLPQGAMTLNENAEEAFITSWASTEVSAFEDNIAVVYKSKNAEKGSSYLIISRDGGATFSDPVPIIHGDSILHRFPAVYLDNEEIFVTYMDFQPNWLDPQYELIHSTDLGLSFEKPVTVTGNYGGESCDCCVSNIFGNSEDLIVLFRNNDMNFRDLYVAHSRRDSLGFTNHYDLNTPTWELFSCPSTGGDGVLNGNKVYSTFMSGHNGRNLIYLSELDLTTGKLTLEKGLIDSIGDRSSYNFPRMAGKGDTVGVVWQETTVRDLNVFFSYSTNGIADLGKDVYLISESLDGRQLNPDIGYDKGVFHFTWQDNTTAHVKYRSFDMNNVMTSVEPATNLTHRFYPNPTDDIIYFKGVKTNTQIQLLDANGQVVQSSHGPTELNLEGLGTGLYYIKIIDETGHHSINKIIKR